MSAPEFPRPSTVDALPTPALLLENTRLERNIAAMARRYDTAGVALRPHVKTSKCWEVARRQLTAGAIGFTCSTPAEVDWLRERGVADLLWAHHPIGPRKVEFAVAAAARGGLTVTLDSPEGAAPLAAAAAAAGVVVPFVLEVNTGHARGGVEPELARERAAAMAAHSSLRLRGVLTHEGQLAGYVGDRPGLERAGREAGTLLSQVAGELRDAGHGIELVSVGSTPGATSAPFAGGVTEARPGTYVYFDANQVRLGSATLDDCALTVLATVISIQRPQRVIIDAGIKAMSSDTIAAAGSLGLVCDQEGRPLPEVTFADGNEEHGFLTGAGAAALRVGDLVRLVPNHACGTTNMWSGLYVVDGPAVTDRWAISARY
ncbi:alanine racemase [Amycolatopsis antarctica]|uniref:Alanine racemase n=1 Tax=Amycolatopsis antarctica TaxID=1854586 RepID=A0A263D7F0_9PSEU|nr:alanine racemase [Amycolatopsis antarctica]OZM74353.1 alanine racemase [Amycolatopsis antarctica]